ncbi:hypothetical protein LCGC14_2796820 [marine sediment metagenome]|uniref:Uncharacterized protein n=1 Tax=marine sediment metagenome TaxID=412755 RepID=A0A0F8ZAY2_9ZZZZ
MDISTEAYQEAYQEENKLKGMLAYLSGGIDRIDDDGIGWRQDIIKKCEDKKILMNFLDPCNKPKHLGQEIGEEKKEMEKLKKEAKNKKDWENIQKRVKEFKRIDYRMVDTCNLCIIYIDTNTHLCGSYFECKVAEEERKPIFAILASHMKKKDLPTWLVDLINWDNIFYGVEECIDYLSKINNGEIEMDDRWIKVI